MQTVNPYVQNVEMQIREGFELELDGKKLVGHIMRFEAEPRMDWDHYQEKWVEHPMEVRVELLFTEQ